MRPMTAVLIGLLVVAVAAVGIAAFAMSNGDPDAMASASPTSGALATPEPSPLYDYTDDAEVGTCYDPIVDKDDDALLALRLRDCDEPHLAQVVGQERITGGPTAPWPGQDAVDADAEQLCLEAFEDFVGIAYEDSQLSGSYISPNEQSWAGGDRAVLCSVEATRAGPLTESVEGIAE